jgi:glycosyltransferase involved in cell wall biosynthesis
MAVFRSNLKRSLTTSYLAGAQVLTHRFLRGHSGIRDFRRVIVVAALGRSNGIASGARLQWNALRQLGVDAELLDVTPSLRNPLFRMPHRPGSAYVFHAGGPQTASLIGSVLPHVAKAHRIAYWAWELPDPPLDWMDCDRNVSEIWTPSAFSQVSLARLSAKPIHVVPHYIPARPVPRRRRLYEPFTVLAMADSRSSLSRKNPEGALRAFRAAFGSSCAVRLVLKLSGRDEDIRSLEVSLGDLLVGTNVRIIKGYLDTTEMSALYQNSDVLLSLHRAEGFGLPIMEAMAHGVPVVATGWSGNLTFMSAADSHLVPYTLVPVNDTSAIYKRSIWAEPDLDEAANMLRRLAEQPDYYSRFADAAYRRISETAPSFPFDLPGVAQPALTDSVA